MTPRIAPLAPAPARDRARLPTTQGAADSHAARAAPRGRTIRPKGARAQRRAALIAAACAALLTAACATPSPPGFEPITTPGQFVDRVAGRPITFPNGGVFVAEPGGAVSGNFDGVTPTGNWEFREGQLCRTVAIGAQSFPEVCNRLEAKPGAIRFFNPDGTLSTEGTLG